MEEIRGVEVKKAVCFQCWRQCGIRVYIEDGEAVKLEGDPDDPLTRGRLCIKSEGAIDFHYHPDRLNYPLKRVGQRGEGRWERISWPQAMDEIAEKLARIQDEYGPEAVLINGGTIHGPGDAMAWRWGNLFGTPNMIYQGKNCGEAEILSDCAVFGFIGWGRIIPGVTRCGIVWGGNPAESSPSIGLNGLRAAQEKGARIIVVDPRRTPTAELADLWLQIRPGTDGALALGMLNVIIKEGLYDKGFVEQWCLGFDQIQKLVQEYPPGRVAEIAWVPEDEIVEAARMYATLKPSAISWGVATCHLGRGATKSAVLGKSILRAIGGSLYVSGGNWFSTPPRQLAWFKTVGWDWLVDQPLRKRDNISADQFPIASPQAYRLYREAMQKVYPEGIGPDQYMIFPSSASIWPAILEEKPYPIKAIITQGGNPLVTLGDSRTIYRALKSERLEMHVAMDLVMTPTGMLADYVLPATDWLERLDLRDQWGLSDLVQGGDQVVEPLYERRDDYQLWRELGIRLGQGEYWPDTLEEMFDQMLEPAGLSFRELIAEKGGWLFPLPVEDRPYLKHSFPTFSGKVELVPSLFERLGYDPLPRYEEPPRSPVSTPELAQEYPLILITGSRTRVYLHSCYRQLDRLRQAYPYPLLQIHPDTAEDLGIADGDTVYIETPEGRVRQKARLTDGIHPRVVHADAFWWYPEMPGNDPCLFGVWDSNINVITPGDPELFDFAGDNPFRALLCRVYKAKDL